MDNRHLHLPKKALNTFLSFAPLPIYRETMRREQISSIYSLVGCNSRQYDDVTIEAKIADHELWSEWAARKYQNLSREIVTFALQLVRCSCLEIFIC